ncbi:MAG: uroporphyrinogen decarboxylase [Nitrospirae bacterium]|nr:uroporphyrinogen decarboxylase [Nitrospirota bacterium]
MLKNDSFLKACRREPVDFTPVWIMRQAGRYMKEYRDIRKKVDFLTMCKSPELAAEVTMLPVDILGVDAAILFSDILIPVEAMGIGVTFTEKRGPVLSNPVRSDNELKALRVPDNVKSKELMPFIPQAIKLILQELGGRVPLIGFSGSPFTLATYIIEGETSRNFTWIKRMMYENPSLLHKLLDKITSAVISYLNMQINAGVHAVQLFDTWAGWLAPDDYREFALPYAERVIRGIDRKGVPLIYFANGVSGILEYMVNSGADVVGLDWRIDMADAVRRSNRRVALQGNLDPCVLYGPPAVIRKYTKTIIEKYGEEPGHIFNLGHGILPDIPVDHAKALVDIVHELSS